MVDIVKRAEAFQREGEREIRDLPTGGLRTDYDVSDFMYHRLMFQIHWGIL